MSADIMSEAEIADFVNSASYWNAGHPTAR